MTHGSRAACAIPALLVGLVPASLALAQQATPPPPDRFGAGAEAFWLACVACTLFFGAASFVFWIVMLVDCFSRDADEFPGATENTKTVWVLALLVSWLVWLYWFAAIVYYFLVRRRMPRHSRAQQV